MRFCTTHRACESNLAAGLCNVAAVRLALGHSTADPCTLVDALLVIVRQGPTGMFYAECPSPGMTQTHRGETLYDLALNVQLTHGVSLDWLGKQS